MAEATSPLDMPLDSLIEKNKSKKTAGRASSGGGAGNGSNGSGGRGRGGGRGGGRGRGGGTHYGRGGAGVRSFRDHPYDSQRQHPRFSQQVYQPSPQVVQVAPPQRHSGGDLRGRLARSGPAKLMISNLASTVTSTDVKELFGELGKLSKAQLLFDEEGKSTGIAAVVYESLADARSAIQQYNGELLDGKEMKIELVGDAAAAAAGGGATKQASLLPQPGTVVYQAAVPHQPHVGSYAPHARTVVLANSSGYPSRGGSFRGGMRGRGRGGAVVRGGGGMRGGASRGGRGGGQRAAPAKKSVDDLDAELDAYNLAREV